MEVQFFEEQAFTYVPMETAWRERRLKVSGVILQDGTGVVNFTTMDNPHDQSLSFVLNRKAKYSGPGLDFESIVGGGFVRLTQDGEVMIDGVSDSLGKSPLPEALVQPALEYARKRFAEF